MKVRKLYERKRGPALRGETWMSEKSRVPPVTIENVKIANEKLSGRASGPVVTVIGGKVISVPTPSRQALERAGISAMRALRDKEAA